MLVEDTVQFGHFLNYLTEASAILNYFKGIDAPGVNELIKILHKKYKISHDPHDIKQVPIKSINKNQLELTNIERDLYSRNSKVMLIFACEVGAAVMELKNQGGYNVQTYNTQSGEHHRSYAGNLKDTGSLIKEHVGKIKQAYRIVLPVSTVKKNINKDKDYDIRHLAKKFQPVLLKTVEKSIADVRGVAMNMLKNDAYDLMKDKIQRLDQLHMLYTDLKTNRFSTDRGSNMWEVLRDALNRAVTLTVLMYHPNELYSQQKENILNDVMNGDFKKLSTILYYLKRELVAT